MRICILTQQAFAAHLGAVDFSDAIDDLTQLVIDELPVVKSIENATSINNQNTETRVTYPRIVCSCDRARPKEQSNGNWTALARVSLEVIAALTSDTDNAVLCEAINDELITDTITADLSALGGYQALCVRFGDCGYELDGDIWRSFWEFEVDCCPSNIT